MQNDRWILLGHQIVKVNAGSERIVYLSELIPAPSHLPLAYIMAMIGTLIKLRDQRRIIAQCEQEGWLMVFAHGYKEYAGYIKRNNHSQIQSPFISRQPTIRLFSLSIDSIIT